MLSLNKNLIFKKFILVGLFTLLAIVVDANLPKNDSLNVQEARFLGIGVKTTKSACFSPTGPGGQKIRVITKEFTVFGIRVGSSWSGGTENC